MKILALETSTECSSCALLLGEQLLFRSTLPSDDKQPQSSEWLLPTVRELLADSECDMSQLDAIAFAAGPGAFTGLRMGCALAQGLAEGAGLPVIAVPTLAGMAWQAGLAHPDLVGQSILVLLDARMGEVYSASYLIGEHGPSLCGNIAVLQPDQVFFPTGTFAVCGNGLTAYPDLSERAELAGGLLLPNIGPSAAAIAYLADLAFARGEMIDSADAAPLYIRNKVAKTVAERLAEGGRA